MDLLNKFRERYRRNPDDISEEEWKQIDKVEDQYFNTVRNLYNMLVPVRKKIPKSITTPRITRLFEPDPYFSLTVAAEGTLFDIFGDPFPISDFDLSYIMIKAYEAKENFNRMISLFALSNNFEPHPYLKDYLFVVFQEDPSFEYYTKDELKLKITEAPPFKGEDQKTFIKFLKDIKTTEIPIKVINEINHPDIYSEYLKLKTIMARIDRFRVDGL